MYKYWFSDKIRNIKDKFHLLKLGYTQTDTWSIDTWFVEIMPRMLKDLRDNLHSHPINMTEEEWKNILNRMIFLLNEMNEDTCSYENKYQEDMDKAHEEFIEKYGVLGNKFEELNNLPPYDGPGKRAYFPSDDPNRPEWKELSDLWVEELIKINQYREDCKNEFFDLMKEHFWDLWD